MKHLPGGRALAIAALAAAALAVPSRLDAQIVVALDPHPVSPAPVGTPVHWIAQIIAGPGHLSYRFRVQDPGGEFRVVKDFDTSRTLDWAALGEGLYQVEVTVRNRDTQETATSTWPYRLASRVTTQPAVALTSSPLVFLFSSPGCGDGLAAVRFGPAGGGSIQQTPFQPCVPGLSVNFYLAGLRENSSYTASLIVMSGRDVSAGPEVSFTTGRADFELSQAVLQSNATPGPEGILLQAALFIPAFATDLNGNLLWYLTNGFTLTRPDSDGTLLGFVESRTDPSQDFLRRVDLLGTTVQETNAARISEQLVAMGKRAITGLHHEVRRIRGDRIVLLAGVEQVLNDVQGPGPVDILGDMIVVLDSDLQVVWAWDAFDHLDVHRPAVLSEQCAKSPGCAPYFLSKNPNDWTHSNSVAEAPDGSLLLSVRHQDWIVKIDYADGRGSGDVLWRLGAGGDFTLDSDDPSPWFSHQHDVGFDPGSSTRISLFDNGNTRQKADPKAVSRGQVLEIDESSRTARLALNAPLPYFSLALGTAQRLSGGNYNFTEGFVFSRTSQFGGIAYSLEVAPPDAVVSSIQVLSSPVYRSFRLVNLYGSAEAERPTRPETRVVGLRE